MGSIKYQASGLLGVEDKAAKKRYQLKRQVWIDADMFDSKAFRALSSKTMWVLLRFRQKRTWTPVGKSRKAKPIYDDKNLTFTYDEAGYFGISQSSFHTIIKKLVEFGFIDVEHQGGFFGRDYSRYSLSERWRDFGKQSFKKVEKKRVLQPGLDVFSWKKRKIKNATKKCSEQLQETTVIH